jgi:hypothetical protein
MGIPQPLVYFSRGLNIALCLTLMRTPQALCGLPGRARDGDEGPSLILMIESIQVHRVMVVLGQTPF